MRKRPSSSGYSRLKASKSVQNVFSGIMSTAKSNYTSQFTGYRPKSKKKSLKNFKIPVGKGHSASTYLIVSLIHPP